MEDQYQLLVGDCIDQMRTLEDGSVNTCITSPPYYGLRDYGHAGQVGLEGSPKEYVTKMVEVFREVRRILRDDGTLWLNLGDSHAGSWGNAGGQNRGKGTQRPIAGKSITTDADTERHGVFVPPAKYGFSDIGVKPKDLIGIPWRVAFALQEDGWYLRSDIIWHKNNPMPESVTDRPTRAHEYLFLLAKSERYYYDHVAIKEPAVTALKPPDANGSTISGGSYNRHVLGEALPKSGRRRDKQGEVGKRQYTGFNARYDDKNPPLTRNKRSVWTVNTKPYKGAHFATFPPALITPCVLAGCPEGGVVIDPFGGSGTTAEVAITHGRKVILCELNPSYIPMQEDRIRSAVNRRLFMVEQIELAV